MFIEGICCRKSLFTLITSIHYITPPIPIFFPMTNLFFCRNIYNPNFFFGLRSCLLGAAVGLDVGTAVGLAVSELLWVSR